MPITRSDISMDTSLLWAGSAEEVLITARGVRELI
jgi:hypothetical protein